MNEKTFKYQEEKVPVEAGTVEPKMSHIKLDGKETSLTSETRGCWYMIPNILDISQLESLIHLSYHDVLDLAKVVDSEDMDIEKLRFLSHRILTKLADARHFDFVIEYRKTYCE